jgi:PPP family 3-phenylpropionic acid transporter
MPHLPRRLQVQLALSYAALVGSNAGLSFLPAHMVADGVTPSTIAALYLLNSAAATVAGPMWSDRADVRGARAALLAPLSAGATALTLGLWLADGPWTWGLALITFGTLRGGTGPLLDALTLDLLGDDRHRYPQLRVWGSLAFLALVAFTGWLDDQVSWGALGVLTGTLAAGTLAVRGLPEATHTPRASGSWGEVARHPLLGPLAFACFLHGVTLTTYDHLFTLLAEARGFSGQQAGAALTLGVGTEVAMMTIGPRLIRRFGARSLMIAAMATGVPRWWLTAAAPDVTTLAAIQALHGVGFGVFWLAAVSLFAAHAPPGRAASAQSLLLIATYGVGRMASMGLAAVALQVTDIATWFSALSVISALATAAAMLAVRRPPERSVGA